MPVRERAGRRRIGGKIRPEPLLLRRARAAAADGRAVRVERDQVPAAEIEAVVALRRIARCGAEVLVVARRSRGLVLVVPGRRTGDPLHASPGRVVRRAELRERPVLVLDVAEREHRLIAGADQQVGRRALAAFETDAEPAVEGAAGRVAGNVAGSRDLGSDRRRAVVVPNRADPGSVERSSRPTAFESCTRGSRPARRARHRRPGPRSSGVLLRRSSERLPEAAA